MILTNIVSKKERVVTFVWQHMLLLISLFFLALGVAVCVRSNLGSSVISSAPYTFSLAGEKGIVPSYSLGMYTNILNVLLVMGQILVLRRQFQLIQLLQLAVGTVFGVLIDLSMSLTAMLPVDTLAAQVVAMVAGSSIMALGVAMEIRCASVTMPGEGLPAAMAKKTGRPFAAMKIYVDVALVAVAVVSMYAFFGEWEWRIVGAGTLFAMIYCGMAVRFISRHLKWFDALLGYNPGFRRYLFGLARFVSRQLPL